MIYTVTLNPAVDKTVTISNFTLDAVNRVESLRMDAGGKGVNVSRWAHMLGAETTALAVLGGSTGTFIADILAQDGIALLPAWVDAPTRTNLKVIDPALGTHTDINEAGAPVPPESIESLKTTLLDRLNTGDIVVIAGRQPPGMSADSLAAWIGEVQLRGGDVFVDMEGGALQAAIVQKPTLIKPNKAELEGYVGHSLADVQAIARAALSIRAQGIEEVVVSLGAEGALFVDDEGAHVADALPVSVGSTVSAGDAMVAALAVGRAKDLSKVQRIRLSVAASTASVMQPGTQVAPKSLVEALQEKVSLPQKLGIL